MRATDKSRNDPRPTVTVRWADRAMTGRLVSEDAESVVVEARQGMPRIIRRGTITAYTVHAT
jgi:hypothetical protein